MQVQYSSTLLKNDIKIAPFLLLSYKAQVSRGEERVVISRL